MWLYTSNKQLENRMKSTSYTYQTDEIGIKLLKDTQNLYTENYFKTLLREIIGNLNKQMSKDWKIQY